MRRSDRQRWAACRTLAELGEVTAAWVLGDVRETPDHPGPDAETLEHAAVVAGVNRAGFVTLGQQSGESRAGSPWEAYLYGVMSAGTAARLAGCLADERLGIVPVPASARRYHLHWYRDRCHPEMIAVLERSRWLWVSDLTPGRDDLLWPALARFARVRP